MPINYVIFQDDFEYIIRKQGLKRYGFANIQLNAVDQSAREKKVRKTKKYFSRLSPEEKKILYQTYQPDFDLFDYSAQEYM